MTRSLRHWWLAFQAGCTYIGTVVGAGFASGQEIFQFFGRFGNWGYLGVAVSVTLFAWLGYEMMRKGAALHASSYKDLNRHLFGSAVGGVFDLVLTAMLFGVSVAMLAGAGALFHEQLGWSLQTGALATLVLTYLTIARGMEGILDANTVIVPLMVGFVLYTGVETWFTHGARFALHAGQLIQQRVTVRGILSAVIYAAFNIGLAAGVLIPLGNRLQDTAVLKKAAMIGATGLGAMLATVMFSLLSHYPQFTEFAVPMGYIAAQMGPALQWLYLFVLWGEIYSTLVGNVFAVCSQFDAACGKRLRWASLIVLLCALVFSQVGFTVIVKYAYAGFGWVCVFIVLAVVWPRSKLPTS